MSGILDMLGSQLGGTVMQSLASQIGADKKQTSSAVSAALPLILGALARNAKTPSGAQSLNQALERDHDGSVLNNLQGLFQQGHSSDGDGILGHVLGGRREQVQRSVGTAAGMSQGQTANLMSMLAPVVMGALGKQKKSQGLDISALTGLLRGEQKQIEQKAPKSSGIMNSLLDQDGDGDVDLGDLMGGIGKLFG